MRLYINHASPFARKPLVALHEAGALAQVETIIAHGSAVDAGTLPVLQNPLGKIPTLVLDDGTVLFDSDVICEYLADAYAPWLYQGDRRWETSTLQSLGNGIMDASILIVYERKLRPTDMQYKPWVDGQYGKITRALDALDQQAANYGSVLCAAPSMANLTIAMALSYLEFRIPAFNWRNERPNLKAWEADIARRPSLMATRPAD